MKNVIISSSRQWNCGDEFIRFGCRNLVENVLQEPVNWILYDRNPDILGMERIWGNSWRGEPLNGVDLAVFAGTPEWYREPVKRLCSAILEAKVRTLYLGVGGAIPQITFGQEDVGCLKAASLIVCRDETAARAVRGIGVPAHVLPCPAFYVHKEDEVRTGSLPRRIGISYQLSKTPNQHIDPHLSAAVIAMIDEIRNKYEVVMICHYKDEYFDALRKGWAVRYSYDAAEYEGFYNECDAVVSTRLHGAILAASCGVPAFLVNECLRATGAAAHFPEMLWSIQSIPEVLEKLDIEAMSERIIAYKKSTREDFQALIRTAVE